MSDEPYKGPAMIAATSMLRPPPARIGKISGNITLPRTVELKKAIAAGAGAFGGIFLWFPLGVIFGHSFRNLLVSIVIGGAIGVFMVSWSPLRGESLGTWLGLTTGSARADKVTVDGRPVRAYLGVAPLPFTAAGATQLFPGAVDIPPGSHDDRGVPLGPAAMRRAMVEATGTPFPAADAPGPWVPAGPQPGPAAHLHGPEPVRRPPVRH